VSRHTRLYNTEKQALEQKTQHILDFLGKIKTANNETVRRDLFSNLLLRLFDEDERARTLLDSKALGAETAIRIPLKGKNKTGFADNQARGHFGARHVHKRILDVPFSKYDSGDECHRRLAALSKICLEKAKAFHAAELKPGEEVSGLKLGSLRLAVKGHLVAEEGEGGDGVR
jgi:hypothetical protein